jgi:hypothetical protein
VGAKSDSGHRIIATPALVAGLDSGARVASSLDAMITDAGR